jgi:hypothetical protein
MDHLRGALTRAFTDAIENSKIIDPLAMGLDILNAKDSTFGAKARSGYWTIMGGNKVIVVHAHQFGGWFPSKSQRNLVLNWLLPRGYSRASAQLRRML